MTDQMRNQTEAEASRRGPARRRVTLNGLSIAYQEWPGRERSTWPPVLLLHGVLQTGAGMANLASHLARHARVIAPDMRGRGETLPKSGPFDPATMAGDMAALIRAIGLEGAVVIGRMHGGVVAYQLAAAYPELVAGLVIGDTPPEIDAAHAEQSLRLLRELPASFGSFDEALAYYQQSLQLTEVRARHDIPLDLVADENGILRWRHDLGVIEQIERAASPRSDWQVLQRITCPTLLIRGQRGAVPPAMADRVCRETAQARCRVQTVIGARHDVFLGPGCEQAFAAIDLMLMGLANRTEEAGSSQATRGEAVADAKGAGEAIIDRLIRAIHSGDPETISTVFAPDCHIVQYGQGGKVREGSIDAVRAAFAQLLAQGGERDVLVGDIIASNDRLACVFAVRRLDADQATTSFTPVFFRLSNHRIVSIESYHVTIPAGDQ